jgi:Tol biopolymer transport system component
MPLWTPDGTRIAFASRRADRISSNLHWQRADGTGEPQRLTQSTNNQQLGSWHPSGKYLAFAEQNLQSGTGDLMILPMQGDEASEWKPGQPTVFLNTPFNEQTPAFSPDGRLIAYISNESGQFEVYVKPFPGPGGKWQVSVAGGIMPTWSHENREILFVDPEQRIMVASYTMTGDSFAVDKPRRWSEQRLLRLRSRSFDLNPMANTSSWLPRRTRHWASKASSFLCSTSSTSSAESHR